MKKLIFIGCFLFSYLSYGQMIIDSYKYEDVETLGGELVLNGGFDDTSNWGNFGANVNVIDGKAEVLITSSDQIYQTATWLEVGAEYRITADVVGANWQVKLGSTSSYVDFTGSITFTGWTGAKYFYFSPYNRDTSQVTPVGSTLDNLSIKEINP